MASSADPRDTVRARPTAWHAVAVGAWLLLLAAIWWNQGVLEDKEAIKYTTCAKQVLAGDFHDFTGNYAKYGAYVVFLLPALALGQVWIAVAAQAALSLAAAFAVERIVRPMAGMRAARLAFTAFLLMPLVQQWVLALYTESFFISMSLLFLERIMRPSPGWLPTAAFALAVLFARPVGMLFVAPAILWLGKERGWYGGPAFAAANAAILVIAISMPGIRRAQLEPIVEGQVICGFTEQPAAAVDFQGSSILAAQVHLFRNHSFAYAAGLIPRRMAAMLFPVRPYFSPPHNALNLFYCLLYPLAVAGIRRKWDARGMPLLVAIGAVYILLVGLTHAEWSMRFLAVLLPIILLAAACGLPGMPRWHGPGVAAQVHSTASA